MLKKYMFYLIRWQMSTPILAIVLIWLSDMSTLKATIIANFVGGAIFFWVDRIIFRNTSKTALWEIQDNVKCVDCGKEGEGYRIVEWRGYNRRTIKNPQFRCKDCKDIKMNKIKERMGYN